MKKERIQKKLLDSEKLPRKGREKRRGCFKNSLAPARLCRVMQGERRKK